MSKVVSFRCSEELDEFLEQEAERRMTTKSTAAQMLLAEKVQEMKGESGGNGESTGVNASDLEEKRAFEFDSREEAVAFRDEFPAHLADRDDRRFKEVYLAAGTPAGVVAEAKRRSN